jgi:uncharacterized membrane protein YqjE
MTAETVRTGSHGPAKPARSTAELTGELARQVTALVHDEIDLAKVELAEKGKRAELGGGMFGAAGILATGAFGCVTICVVAALHAALAVWLAALIVAAVYAVIAGALILAARKKLRQATPPLPQEAIESTKEDVAWLTEQAKSARR